jgi:trigger factor
MQVSVETTQGLERRLTISVPAEKVDVEVNNRLRQMSKTQRINGFRPGKVPPSVIQKRFGKSVRQEVAGEIMQRNFVDAIVAEKINPAGRPSFVAKSNEIGKALEFEATFEIYPEVELQDLETIAVERPAVEVTDADLDEMFVTLQKQHQTWKENKRKTKKGDKLTLDFNGRVDGEEFEGGKAENFELELGAGRMIPGFEKEITGMKSGEEGTIKVTFPDDYHAENLKGKEAEFDIVIHKTEGPVLPKIDEDFAKLFGIEEGGVEALRVEVKIWDVN